jgi:hypothetical protein
MSSVIVNDLDLLRSLIRPSEHDPPLIIYPDRMPARQVASQGFQVVSRRCRKVAEHSGVIELYQLATSHPGYICRKSLWNTSLLENQLSERTAETPDHRRLCITT